MPIPITSDNFKNEVLQSQKIVMVDCYADWCGPCKALKPTLLRVEENNNITLGLLDVDKCHDLGMKLNIKSVPIVMFYYKGEKITEVIGIKTQKEYEEKIKQILENGEI